MTPGGRFPAAQAALFLAPAFLFVVGQCYYWPQVADDAFIFFRYAENLASGHGLAWNPTSEPPVEGFSSPLWVLVLAASKVAGAEPLATSKILGSILFALTVAGTAVLAYRIANNRRAAIVSSLFVAALKPFHFWAPSGMETSLHACALIWCAVALSGKRAAIAGLALGAVGITRPEGPLLVAGAIAVTARDHRGRWSWKESRWVRILAPALLVTLGYMIFRLIYFGDVLPNTWYAKAGGPAAWRFSTGLRYLRYVLPLWLAAGWLTLRLVRTPGVSPARRQAATLAITFMTLELIAVAWGGGDWMWHYRFLAPVLATGVAAAAGAYDAVVRASGSSWRGTMAGLTVATALAITLLGCGVLGPGVIAAALRGEELPADALQEGTMVAVSQEVADFIVSDAEPDAIIAVNHAGAVPYFTGLTTVDMTGLNDHHIAHEAKGVLHEKHDAAYVLSRRPDYVVLNSRIRPEPGAWYVPGYWEGETALVMMPEFASHYAFFPRYWTWSWLEPAPENYIIVARRVK